jgi:nicotinate-nucleotide adenylyltransferase
LIPAGEQPFKSGRHVASPGDRAAMVELAVAGEPGLMMDRIEVERAGPSYTVDTVAALRSRWPDAELTLLLGADTASEFPAWREPERIRSLARVVVFSRDGATPTDGGWHTVQIPRVDLASRDIRARVRAGQSIRYMVPQPVAEYIAARGLYRERGANTG